MEEKLRQSGFTQKEIQLIVYLAEKDKLSYAEILRQLNRVFIGFTLLKLLIAGICVYSFFQNDSVGLFGTFFATIIVLIIMEFFAPTLIGAKVFLYLRKRDFT